MNEKPNFVDVTGTPVEMNRFYTFNHQLVYTERINHNSEEQCSTIHGLEEFDLSVKGIWSCYGDNFVTIPLGEGEVRKLKPISSAGARERLGTMKESIGLFEKLIE